MAVSSGMFQYSLITVGDLMASSPTSPTGSSAVPVSRSTILASMSGRGMPMLPSTFLPYIGLQWVATAVSVSPYPSTSLPPVNSSKVCLTERGRGADPLMHALMDFTSYLAMSGWELMALYIVGTPMNKVGLYLLMALSRASMSLGLTMKIKGAAIVTAQAMVVTIPKIWKRGMAARGLSPGILTSGSQAEHCCTLATTLRCRMTAALGTPVVPPVYWKSDMSSLLTDTWGSSAGYFSTRFFIQMSPSTSSTRCPPFFSITRVNKNRSRPPRCSLRLVTMTFLSLVLGLTSLPS